MNDTIAHVDLFAALAAPFTTEVKHRTQSGKQLSYVTARTVMNRLDEVLGPANWWDEYVPSEKSVLCRLTIRLPDGSTLTKCDAGGYAGMADSGDDDKSGYSDSFKRAAVKFGVGRHLYGDGVPSFVGGMPSAASPGEAPASPPRNGAAGRARNREIMRGKLQGPQASAGKAPGTGRALFAWAKEHGELERCTRYGREQGLAARIVDWQPGQVAQALAALSVE